MNKISKRGLRCKRFFEKNFMFFRRRGNTRISGGFPHIKLEMANTVSGAPGAQRPENRPLPRHAGLLRRRLPRSGQLLQRDEGQRGMGRRAPPPGDGRATGDGSPMWKPCQCDGVAIANAASCQCCRSQLGIGTEDRQHWQHSPPCLPSTLQKPRDFVMATVCRLWPSQNLPLFRIDF